MKYELKTLKDVFDKVPADRIRDCLNELAISMIQAKAMQGLFDCVPDNEIPVYEWPENVEWVDDGKIKIELSFYESENKKEFLRVEATLDKDTE